MEGLISSGEKQNLLKKSEISLWLDSYNDIFSDFDPRPYAERALSQDFLNEAQRASRDKPSGQIELKFLIPVHQRSLAHEALIKKRLHDHFKKHHDILEKERSSVVKQGFGFLVFGFIFMFSGAYVLFHYGPQVSLLKEMLIVVLQPGGWFLFWEGLGLMIFEAKTKKPDLDFYEKMAHIEISFTTY